MSIIRADRIFENTSTAGGGAYSLGGAILGYKSFSAVCTVGDTFNYFVEAVDASGTLTGEWETGTGTYSSGNMLTRTFVAASSNSNLAVSWAAGIKRIALAMTAATLSGFVIERGTNSNGDYVRFGDGTQICTMAFADIACPANGLVQLPTRTYPAAFMATPAINLSANPSATYDFYGVIAGNASIGSCTPVVRNGATAQNAFLIYAVAFGRWSGRR